MLQQHNYSSFTSACHYTEGLYLGAQFDFEGISQQVFTEKFLLEAVLYRQAAGFNLLNSCAELKRKGRKADKDTTQSSLLTEKFPILNTVILFSTVIILKADTNLVFGEGACKAQKENINVCVHVYVCTWDGSICVRKNNCHYKE